jgi:hypothetical protein
MSTRDDYFRFIQQITERETGLISRDELLSIGNEAAATGLGRTGTDELSVELLQEEVDRIITKRFNLPTYPEWLHAGK